MSVIIGVDPHKASHTAVAIGGDERGVAKVTVRATRVDNSAPSAPSACSDLRDEG